MLCHSLKNYLGKENTSLRTHFAADPCAFPLTIKANLFFTALVFCPAEVVDIAIISFATSQKTLTFWREAKSNRTLASFAVQCAYAQLLFWSQVRPLFPPITESDVHISPHNLSRQQVVYPLL